MMIPVAKPLISKNAQKYVKRALKSGWVSSKGPFVEEFEKKFARFVGTKYAISTNSGTAALHLALAALGIGKGDEVIIPAFTMVSVPLAIVYQGAKPVLVDVEKDTGNIDASKIEEKITKKTKVIIAVHNNGHPVDLESILKISKKHDLLVLEDAAEAHGAKYKTKKDWKMVGGIGKVGCFSLYANKIITTGEGGIITTNDKNLKDRLFSLRNLARTKNVHFLHKEISFTYRLSNLQAALGVAQLEEVKNFLKRKKEIAKLYTGLLAGIGSLVLPIEKKYAKRLYWNYEILLPDSRKRDKLAKFLARNGVETRNSFISLHKQPAFLKIGLFKKGRYENAEYLSKRGLSLPSGVAIKDSEIYFVVKKIKKFLK